MKKSFKYYIVAWAILLAIYNVVVFAIRPIVPGFEVKYDARFLISWGFVIAAFIGQLSCAFVTFKSENRNKLFLNIPLITQSYSALVLMTVVGSILMLIPDCPEWVASIVCIMVFAFSAIAVIKAKAAAEIVADVGSRIQAKTEFIKTLTADAEHLMNTAKTPELKAEAKKVYEAIRYSDPMSSAALVETEMKIEQIFSNFSDAITAGITESAIALGAEIISLADLRNKKCKLLK